MNWLRDWFRGYSDGDVESAVRKLEQHWTLPAGSIIPLTGREMKAVVREGLTGAFLEVRDMEFVNHPLKRERVAAEQEGK